MRAKLRDLAQTSLGDPDAVISVELIASGLDEICSRSLAPADVFLVAGTQSRPFHLDTAQRIVGVAFTDGVMTLQRDGSIDQAQPDAREFHRRGARYAFDRSTFQAARDEAAVDWLVDFVRLGMR